MRLFIASLNASANPPVAKELAAALETRAPQQGLPVQKLERQASAVQAGQAMGESFDQQGQEAFRWLSVTLGTQCDAGDYILVLAPQLAELDALIRWYGSQSTALRPHLGIVLAHAPGKGLPGEQDPLLSEKLYQQFSQQLSNLAAHKLTYFCTDEDLADQYLPWLRERLQYLPETVENRCRTILNTARSAELARESITSSWGTAALLRHLLGPRRGVSLLDGVGGDLTSVLLQTLTGVESYVTTATAALPLDQLATQVGTTSLNRRGFHAGESNWPEAVAGKMDLVIGSALADAQELQALWSALSDGGVLFLQGDVTQRPEGFATNGWQVDIRLPGNPGQQVASLVGRQAESYVQVRAALLNLPQHLHWLPLPAALEPAALTPARQERLWAVQAKIQAGQLAAAAKDMAQALADDPDDSELERCHASTLQALGDQEGAIAHWSHLVQQQPERQDATEALARALTSLGEYGIAGAIIDNHQQYGTAPSPALGPIRKAVLRTSELIPEALPEHQGRIGLLQIHTFYPAYLEQFYARNPALPGQDFATQIKALEADAFSANHMLTPYLGALGYEAQLIVANDPVSQGRWAAQHGLPNGIGMMEVVRRQVEAYRPEILYLSEPISFDSRFLETLSYKPRLVLGWRGALAPPDTRWHGFDVMLSGLSGIRELSLQLGAAHGVHFFPGHPNWINPKLNGIIPETDVLFTGQWTIGQHEKRNQQLLALADAATDPRAPFSLALHLSGQTDNAPSSLAPFLRPPVYGLDMYRALASARIVVDSRADHWMFDPLTGQPKDVGRGETVNMRLFEVTGAGRFLITERFDNLSDYFEPGLEVETFSDREELVDKIRYYLAHPDKLEAIARRGKERCRRDYAMEWRAAHFDRIVRRHFI
ncbi:glycosyltransferase family protein [Azospira oryzae]|uniref:glycosyltransferase family protein n=1 Tax=Azospira oryzae TaxID=146939 RepID=UPI0019629610|nr:glycosyltransferase [Azospira oryzae]